MPAQDLMMRKSQASIAIVVVATIIILIGLLVWAHENKLPAGAVDTTAIEARINGCIIQSANEIFTKFGESGNPGRDQYQVQIGNIIENVPLYDVTPNATALAASFSFAISNLTQICVAKIDFAPMNAVLLNNPESLVVTFAYDKKTQMSNVSLNTTLVFGASNHTTVKLTNMSATQYPLAFNAYITALTKIEEHMAADPNYYLTTECQIYRINGQTNISITPVDAKHTYIELTDGAPLADSYLEPYVWKEVVTIGSTHTGVCTNR